MTSFLAMIVLPVSVFCIGVCIYKIGEIAGHIKTLKAPRKLFDEYQETDKLTLEVAEAFLAVVKAMP